MNAIKGENGEIHTEDNLIKQSWKQHCQGLYAGKDGLGCTSEPIELEEDEHYIPRSEAVVAMKKNANFLKHQVTMTFQMNR